MNEDETIIEGEISELRIWTRDLTPKEIQHAAAGGDVEDDPLDADVIEP